jgi:hypothetical protein
MIWFFGLLGLAAFMCGALLCLRGTVRDKV